MEAGGGLSRSDLACVGPVAALNTLKLLPLSSKSRRQKVVVGDSFGAVTCLQVKRGEAGVVFKTQAGDDGNAVSALVLANGGSDDKVFVAEGRSVRGINKKGKEFCHIRTNLSETIRNLAVCDKNIWCAGELTYASYTDGAESEYLHCAEAISSMVAASSAGATVLGGRDHRLRAVRGGRVVSELTTRGAVSALEAYAAPFQDPSAAERGALMFGTAAGAVGVCACEPGEAGSAPRLRGVWSDLDAGGGEVNCLAAYDLHKSDVKDIIVGRDDGRVQVLRVLGEGSGLEVAERRSAASRAALQFERFVDESVRAVQAGVVSTPGYDEVVVCTYAGNLISFTTEALDAAEEGDKKGRTKAALDAEGRVASIKEQLTALEKEIEAAQRKVTAQEGAAVGGGGSAAAAAAAGAVGGIGFQQLQVSKRLSLQPEDGSHVLSLEMPVAIDIVLLQSTTPLTLLDYDDAGGDRASQAGAEAQQQQQHAHSQQQQQQQQQQNFVVSTGPAEERGKYTQAVYRCTEPSKRVDIRLRCVEGQYGQLRATVVANLRPNKIAQQLTFEVKPLSLHSRLPGAPPAFRVAAGGDEFPEEPPALSQVSMEGKFSLNQAHDWVSALLPEVPAVPPSAQLGGGHDYEREMSPEQGQGSVELWYQSALFGSVLCVRYREGLCEVRSDSVSAIAIAREVLSAEASRRKVAINIKSSIDPRTVPQLLARLDRMLAERAKLARDVELLDALQEIAADSGGDLGFLSPEHQSALRDAQALRSRLAQWPEALESLHGVIYDLYVDVKKFAGHDVRGPEAHASLGRILDNYDLASLLAFFAA